MISSWSLLHCIASHMHAMQSSIPHIQIHTYHTSTSTPTTPTYHTPHTCLTQDYATNLESSPQSIPFYSTPSLPLIHPSIPSIESSHQFHLVPSITTPHHQLNSTPLPSRIPSYTHTHTPTTQNTKYRSARPLPWGLLRFALIGTNNTRKNTTTCNPQPTTYNLHLPTHVSGRDIDINKNQA